MEKMRLIESADVKVLFPQRAIDFHKGTAGKLLVAAGSYGMAGAAILCARAALRSGVGLVNLAVPDTIVPILQTAIPEATCLPREVHENSVKRYQAAVIGPGIGTEPSEVVFLREMLRHFPGSLLLDADALNLIAQEDLFDAVRARKGKTIITPHPGEAQRLLSCSKEKLLQERVECAVKLAEKTGAITVLKGAGTIVAEPNGTSGLQARVMRNTTGNPGMATGGSGDVLAGIIGAFCAQGIPPFEAATAGVYLHGRAGDLSAAIWGEHGMMAGDLPDQTAIAMKELLGK